MKYKTGLLVTLLLVFATVLHAQFPDPTQWRVEVKPASVKPAEKDLFDIYLIATIESPWHIYTQHLPEGGPIPTKIEFSGNPLIKLVGTPKEVGKPKKVHEEVFKMDVTFYNGEVSFVQRVRKKAGIKTNLTAEVTYMICKEGECLPVKTRKIAVVLVK